MTKKEIKADDLIYNDKDECWCNWYECPLCGDKMITEDSNYCPNCGVKINREDK